MRQLLLLLLPLVAKFIQSASHRVIQLLASEIAMALPINMNNANDNDIDIDMDIDMALNQT